MKDECQIVFHKKTNTSVFVYEDQSQQKFISITKVAIAKRLKFPTIRVVWFCCFDLDQSSTHVWPSFLQQCNVQWAQNQFHFFFATLFFVHWTHNQASATSFLLCNFIFALKLYFCFATLFNMHQRNKSVWFLLFSLMQNWCTKMCKGVWNLCLSHFIRLLDWIVQCSAVFNEVQSWVSWSPVVTPAPWLKASNWTNPSSSFSAINIINFI